MNVRYAILHTSLDPLDVEKTLRLSLGHNKAARGGAVASSGR
jgi:hypothetical protein